MQPAVAEKTATSKSPAKGESSQTSATSSVQFETSPMRTPRRRSSARVATTPSSGTTACRARSTRQAMSSSMSASTPSDSRSVRSAAAIGPVSRCSQAPDPYQTPSISSSDLPIRCDQRSRKSRDRSSGQRASVFQRSKTTARTATSGSCLRAALGRVGFARVEPELEQAPEALARPRTGRRGDRAPHGAPSRSRRSTASRSSARSTPPR